MGQSIDAPARFIGMQYARGTNLLFDLLVVRFQLRGEIGPGLG